jgi:hypothetical protein
VTADTIVPSGSCSPLDAERFQELAGATELLNARMVKKLVAP